MATPDPHATSATPAAQPTGAVEEIEVRGHIIDSLLLPKILDRILQMGGTFEIHECHDRRPAGRPQLRADRRPGRHARDARRDHRRPDRARRLAGPPRGRPGRAGRHRRGLPRGVLQHHQPADPGPARRPLGRRRRTRRWTAASPSTRTTRTARCVPMVRRDGRRCRSSSATTGVRVVPMERPRERQPVRLHGLERLQREAQGGQPGGRGRVDPGDPRRRQEGPAGRRAGDRPHRLGRARRPADPRRLDPDPVRRQRPGDPRHRAGPLRHQPGRLAGRTARRSSTATSTTSGRSTPSGGSAASAPAVDAGRS